MAEQFHDESALVLSQYEVTEQKFLPRTAEFREALIDKFRSHAVEKIRQLYLSHPSDEYILWISEQTHPEESRVALKDRGTWTADGLRRNEFRGVLHEGLFDYYDNDVPSVNKLRARPREGVIIDFFDDGHVHAESVDPSAWRQFIFEQDCYDQFVEVTNVERNRAADNEWRAHRNYRLEHGGREAFAPLPPLDVNKVMVDIASVRNGEPIIVQIGGRSGSGKSTFIRNLQMELQGHNISSLFVSTDDYNYGRTYLYGLANKRGEDKWVDYDSDEVYDLSLFKTHLEKLKQGEAIPKFYFDHQPEERLQQGEFGPAEVVIFEGIKANHPNLRDLAHLSYEIPTSLATALGRRCMRDLRERPRFAKPRHNLEYYLKYAEPAYRAQSL
jgi:uridine kinase